MPPQQEIETHTNHITTTRCGFNKFLVVVSKRLGLCVWTPFSLSFYRFPIPLPFPEHLTQDSRENMRKYEKILVSKLGKSSKTKKNMCFQPWMNSRNELQHVEIPEDRSKNKWPSNRSMSILVMFNASLPLVPPCHLPASLEDKSFKLIWRMACDRDLRWPRSESDWDESFDDFFRIETLGDLEISSYPAW